MNHDRDVYRAYLSARELTERLLLAYAAEKDREHHLKEARREIEAASDRLDTAILAHIKTKPDDTATAA